MLSDIGFLMTSIDIDRFYCFLSHVFDSQNSKNFVNNISNLIRTSLKSLKLIQKGSEYRSVFISITVNWSIKCEHCNITTVRSRNCPCKKVWTFVRLVKIRFPSEKRYKNGHSRNKSKIKGLTWWIKTFIAVWFKDNQSFWTYVYIKIGFISKNELDFVISFK